MRFTIIYNDYQDSYIVYANQPQDGILDVCTLLASDPDQWFLEQIYNLAVGEGFVYAPYIFVRIS